MIDNAQLRRMESLFGAYFHEDWTLDADDPDDIVKLYISSATTAQAKQMADDIKTYVESVPDDAELYDQLLKKLGCSYDPEADGINGRDWLLRVAAMLSK
jgi:hypothetical protein